MFVELLMLMCYITSTYTQTIVNPSCRQIDFNDVSSIDQFEPCDGLSALSIKSYADVELEPFRSDVKNHLSSLHIGHSCLRLRQTLNLDGNTQIFATIYLNSSPGDDRSYVEIRAFDTQTNVIHVFGQPVRASVRWDNFSENFSRSVSSAKIEIHANTSADAILAIEYLHVNNGAKPEPYCVRVPATTSTTTTTPVNEPTVTEATVTEATVTEATVTEATVTESTVTESIDSSSSTSELKTFSLAISLSVFAFVKNLNFC